MEGMKIKWGIHRNFSGGGVPKHGMILGGGGPWRGGTWPEWGGIFHFSGKWGGIPPQSPPLGETLFLQH